MPYLAATEDVSFFYTDSGAPSSPAYSTIVIFHGYRWHSAVFDRLLPLAPSHNIRLICVNRRGYPGTTPFTPEDEAGLASSDPSQTLAAQGVIFARFLAKLPDALGLPRPSADGEGGIVLAGWSLGTLFVRLVLTALDQVDEPTRNVLRTYVQRLILWDVPSPFIGVVPPPEAYFPLADERLSPAERMSIFIPLGLRVLHPRPPSRKPTYGAPDQDRPPSVHAPELLGIMASEASCLTGSRSVWLCTLAPWWFEDAAKKAGIPLKGKMIPDSNHSAMWDNPEITIRALEECCSAVKPHKVAAHM
ncbi:alpha/beta-hydrolase [Schizophyllum commune Tattone D]|nr:alpha/beta-hydrolase [Schizophyllum commune Tattone D]